MKLVRLLANMAYGSRKEVAQLIRAGRVTDAEGRPLADDAQPDPTLIRIDGRPLDPPQGGVVMLHKPVGYTCSTKDRGALVYELLPPRFRLRKPVVSPVGRLDRDTSGLLLFTDDGALLHRIISPRAKVAKIYEAELARPLGGREAAIFASGTLMLDSESTPLAPAELQPTGERSARLTLHEGRYHQVRRMFAAVGNHVERLHRPQVGGLTLGDLAEGDWRLLSPAEVGSLFAAAPPAATSG